MLSQNIHRMDMSLDVLRIKDIWDILYRCRYIGERTVS